MGPSIESLRAEIREFCRIYQRQYREPVALKVIAQKWGKRFSSAGLVIIDALREYPEFVLDLSRSGAWRVGLQTEVPLNKKVMLLLRQSGGRMARGELMGKLLLMGPVDTTEANKAIDFMVGIGVIREDGGFLDLSVDPDQIL